MPLPKGTISYAFAIPDSYFSILLLKPCSRNSLCSWHAGNTLMSSLNLLCCNSFLILTTVGNSQRISKEYLEVLQQMQVSGKCEWIKVWSLSLLNLCSVRNKSYEHGYLVLAVAGDPHKHGRDGVGRLRYSSVCWCNCKVRIKFG